MNKYQRLFKELQKEKETSPKDANDHIMVFDGLNTFIRSFGRTITSNEKKPELNLLKLIII